MTSAIEAVQKEINEQIRQRATAVLMLTSGEPDVEEPNDLGDLDSFSVVQLILSLEDYYQVPLLEDMPTFEGKTFEEPAALDALHDGRGGQVRDQTQHRDLAAVAAHEIGAHHLIRRVVAALDQHVRAQQLEQRLGRVFLEAHHPVDSGQR